MSEKDITPTVEKALVDGKDLLASKQDALLQLGQIQAFSFMGKLVTVTELKLALQIKETKSYKGLTYQDDKGKVVTVTTWEQCCKHILKTDCQNLDRRLVNLQQFGEEFFEAAQQMKLGYRDLRALRQLPEEDQTLVIESEAVETGDTEAVKELIDELKAKHSKEKDKLAQELDATERMLKVSRDSSSKKEEEIIKLKTDLESKKFSAERWKGEAKSFFEALAKTQNQVREGFNQMLVLSEQLETVKIDDKTYDAAKSAFYADSKILLTQLAHVWNEIHRTYGDLDDARPSGEWLAEMGFEGTEVME
ncbi:MULTISPECIES: hypothetical protein [unclassified Pseudoalteromonas]|uniref:hypothetical protein n=1 Tax=unclassified Pseudoalteromonas TaxID=194690 RepID=UPI001F45EC3C|nr:MULTISPECIES: hypothetical protein [unclassified Pseudoalteromonas]MCF2829811.1 hypothetical protein [Pseudoalteromonas sp. OF5H-5]MCF2834526.1 hypothetical protein [Pseudoalteromonas sp. DL2-H6]MCF2927779.1 hypothetical protein [Pseudoalteromonas sp. DL2-H1]